MEIVPTQLVDPNEQPLEFQKQKPAKKQDRGVLSGLSQPLVEREHSMAHNLDDDEILAMVEGEINGSSDYMDSEISSQREKAMEYFYGEPFGNEEDGRSQVVVTDVQDTLMWMMPSLMRIFTAGDKVVKFIPEGPEDEAIADQATKYVNHVFYKQNDGFMVLYNMFLDSLMQKVGVVKHYWEDIEKTTTETYEN